MQNQLSLFAVFMAASCIFGAELAVAHNGPPKVQIIYGKVLEVENVAQTTPVIVASEATPVAIPRMQDVVVPVQHVASVPASVPVYTPEFTLLVQPVHFESYPAAQPQYLTCASGG